MLRTASQTSSDNCFEILLGCEGSGGGDPGGDGVGSARSPECRVNDGNVCVVEAAAMLCTGKRLVSLWPLSGKETSLTVWES